MKKPAFCICKKNKGTDQLCGNRAVDQCLCFCYIQKTIPLLYFLSPKFQASCHFLVQPCVSDLVGNPEGRFCCDVAHIYFSTEPADQIIVLVTYGSSKGSKAIFFFISWFTDPPTQIFAF